MGWINTWAMFNGCTRPDWAGHVTISDNLPNGLNAVRDANPRTVMGIIVPVTTKGRKSAPVPLSGASTGKAFGTDKGHLMALELGGPDISANIAPQSSLWQQSGGWRSVETNALTLAQQWMGIGGTYDPGSAIPRPENGGFFRVGPYPETDPLTGEPKLYTGTVTKIKLVAGLSGGYLPHPDEETHIFYIGPEGVWWERGAKKH
jgi:hypothetical protein